MRINMRRAVAVILVGSSLLSVAVTFAAPGEARAGSEKSYYGFEGKRGKKLDFDGDYIESMNKHPLDSLTELSEADKRRKNIHLYRKRSNFGSETAETIQQVRYN